MVNLPESLFDDPKGASSSNSAPQNTARPHYFSPTDRAEIQLLINSLNQPLTRAEAIVRLNSVYKTHKGRGGRELGWYLWNSKDTMFSLLEEVTGIYTLLWPPRLRMGDATRVCNALTLIQCIASHPDAKLELLKAQIPVYIYPLLNTTEKQLLQYDYLRLNSLGVIGALVKEESPQSAEIVGYLIQSEMVPLCLRCMDVGSDLTKTLAAFVLGKMLGQPDGNHYCSSFPERFYSVSRALSKVVDEFSGRPPPALMKNTLICYLQLTQISRCCEALKKCYPQRLRNPTYLYHVCDPTTKVLAEEVLNNIMEGGQQVRPNVSGMR